MLRFTGRRAALAGAAMLLGSLSLGGAAFAGTANVPGPYDPTESAPSGNGGGNSSANVPMSGSVGNADTKNPQGQLPGPQDNNNGYECDGNQGIALGNPAHTACTVTPPV
jgi:hypothetical protein